MKTWLLIPIKHLDRAKSRLSPILSPEERQSLVMTLLHHVVAVGQTLPEIEEIILISDSTLIGSWAEQHQVRWLDTPAPLNAAVQEGYSLAKQEGAQRILVLPADLPLLKKESVQKMLSQKSQIVIAPDFFQVGTNGLVLRDIADFTFMFGPDSLQQHIKQARLLGVDPHILIDPGLAFDIDWPEDLAKWERIGPQKPVSNRQN